MNWTYQYSDFIIDEYYLGIYIFKDDDICSGQASFSGNPCGGSGQASSSSNSDHDDDDRDYSSKKRKRSETPEVLLKRELLSSAEWIDTSGYVENS